MKKKIINETYRKRARTVKRLLLLPLPLYYARARVINYVRGKLEGFFPEKYVTARNTRRTSDLHKKQIDHLTPYDESFGRVEKTNLVTYIIMLDVYTRARATSKTPSSF